jgi:hypothetical protein
MNIYRICEKCGSTDDVAFIRYMSTAEEHLICARCYSNGYNIDNLTETEKVVYMAIGYGCNTTDGMVDVYISIVPGFIMLSVRITNNLQGMKVYAAWLRANGYRTSGVSYDSTSALIHIYPHN